MGFTLVFTSELIENIYGRIISLEPKPILLVTMFIPHSQNPLVVGGYSRPGSIIIEYPDEDTESIIQF